MAESTYTPLFSEIFEKVGKLKTKKQKVSYLQEQNTESLRMVIKSSFDPKIEWLLPDGPVPYVPNDAPEGTEHTDLAWEARKLYNFVKGGNGALSQNKREAMFVQLLEGLHPNEAEILVAAKDKSLHKMYKGLSANVVKEAFFWNDDYMLIENETYDQRKGSASGV
jgi:hypothetical protein|tara:strand:+ start:234 stop:731 length:498 start_codon:yes stop_codon:yes gene_type:complete